MSLKQGIAVNRLAAVSILLAACIVFSSFMFTSGGWLSGGDQKLADTDASEVELPPILYILDSDGKDITQLSLTGLDIGVQKDIVFCISSVYPITDDVNYRPSFDLEVAYTNNLGASFDLFNAKIVTEDTAGAVEYVSQNNATGYFTIGDELEPIPNSAALNISENTRAYGDGYNNSVQTLNQATYKRYDYTNSDTSPNNTMLFKESDSPANPLYDISKCRFFILRISWGVINNRTLLEKETDLVYILARGGSASE